MGKVNGPGSQNPGGGRFRRIVTSLLSFFLLLILVLFLLTIFPIMLAVSLCILPSQHSRNLFAPILEITRNLWRGASAVFRDDPSKVIPKTVSLEYSEVAPKLEEAFKKFQLMLEDDRKQGRKSDPKYCILAVAAGAADTFVRDNLAADEFDDDPHVKDVLCIKSRLVPYAPDEIPDPIHEKQRIKKLELICKYFKAHNDFGGCKESDGYTDFERNVVMEIAKAWRIDPPMPKTPDAVVYGVTAEGSSLGGEQKQF